MFGNTGDPPYKALYMEELICIAGFGVLIAGIVTGGWVIAGRHKRLDQTYHDALHAESQGQYANATKLYQSILDSSGPFFLMDDAVRSLVKRRMDTIRYQQDYLSQFAVGAKIEDHLPSLETRQRVS
jgi:hypothetical protein